MELMNFAFGIIIPILLAVGLARIAFRVNHRVELQQMQLKISILIAKKLGVEKTDIDAALKD
jgi:hypothetical protein